jgi:hypothetical protein
MVTEGTVRARQAVAIMNLAKPRTRLDVRGNFLREVEDSNSVPEDIKMAPTAG